MNEFSLRGAYGEAKIFTELIDNRSISDIVTMLCQPFVENQTIRIMPDVHAGEGCVIGTTLTVDNKVCPNIVGVDIGCGLYAVRLKEQHIDFERLDNVIRHYVPSGFCVHESPLSYSENINLQELYCRDYCDLQKANRSIGTLGGGNHFIEVNRDSKGFLWLVVHSGSRHLGLQVARFYQKQAIRQVRDAFEKEKRNIINNLKACGREKEIGNAIKSFSSSKTKVPESLCYLEGGLFDEYIHDMQIVQRYADINRRAIIETILTHMNLNINKEITTVHNYIDTDRMILRKGAVSAEEGEMLIIPMNMRDGSLICIGKGNPEWNYSAPHGAGRLLSRSEAKKQIGLQEYTTTMKDVWSTSVNINTIDESPMAYKPIEKIVDNIKDTVDIVDIIKPLYNFKA